MKRYLVVPKIQERLNTMGWTQDEAARQTGIPQSTLSRMLRNKQKLYSIDHLVSLSRSLNVTMEDLFSVSQIIWSMDTDDVGLLHHLVDLVKKDAGHNKVTARAEDMTGLTLAIESQTSVRPMIRIRCWEEDNTFSGTIRNFDLVHFHTYGKDIIFEIFRVLERKGFVSLHVAAEGNSVEQRFYQDCGFVIEREEQVGNVFRTIYLSKRLNL